LAAAARALDWEAVPPETKAGIRRLFLDWVGSALAGAPSDSARILELVVGGESDSARAPSEGNRPPGTATVLTTLSGVAPLTAALVNGAASHVVEMDDLHNASIYHPATCVFPALLAAAEAAAATPSRFLAAAVAGYEVSIRVGEALGPEHYAYFHTTGTAGTFGAAVAVGHLLGLDEQRLLWAMGNAATQAAGLWQFLVEGSMSKPLHTAKAAYNGALAAYLAERGFTGPEHALCGELGLLAATTPAGALAIGNGYDEALKQEQLTRLLAGVGERADTPAHFFSEFKTPAVSIKYHASCRHTHSPVDALLQLMREHGLEADDLQVIRAHVYTGAYERLKDVVASTPWAAKFNVPFCLAQAALRGHLSLDAFTEEALTDPRVTKLRERVSLYVDPSLDDVYPRFWPAWVEVETTDGEVYAYRIDTPKGDPENPVTDAELDAKFLLLATGTLHGDDPDRLLGRLRTLDSLADMTQLFAGIGGARAPVDSERSARLEPAGLSGGGAPRWEPAS
jgi:2-methylcitrate dehydratase PrpD